MRSIAWCVLECMDSSSSLMTTRPSMAAFSCVSEWRTTPSSLLKRSTSRPRNTPRGFCDKERDARGHRKE
jgi:hypothetical protein